MIPRSRSGGAGAPISGGSDSGLPGGGSAVVRSPWLRHRTTGTHRHSPCGCGDHVLGDDLTAADLGHELVSCACWASVPLHKLHGREPGLTPMCHSVVVPSRVRPGRRVSSAAAKYSPGSKTVETAQSSPISSHRSVPGVDRRTPVRCPPRRPRPSRRRGRVEHLDALAELCLRGFAGLRRVVEVAGEGRDRVAARASSCLMPASKAVAPSPRSSSSGPEM